jgi:hypothetical protein
MRPRPLTTIIHAGTIFAAGDFVEVTENVMSTLVGFILRLARKPWFADWPAETADFRPLRERGE